MGTLVNNFSLIRRTTAAALTRFALTNASQSSAIFMNDSDNNNNDVLGLQSIQGFLNRLLFLSPKAWWGVLQFYLKSDLNPSDGTILRNGILGSIVAPILLWMIWDNLHTGTSTTMNPIQNEGRIGGKRLRLLFCFFFSPWMLHSMTQVFSQFSILIQSFIATRKRRFHALPSAYLALQERVMMNRAYSTGRYNVFLPHSLAAPTTTTTEGEAITTSNSDDINSVTKTNLKYLQPWWRQRQQKSQQQQQQQQQNQPAILLFPGLSVPHVAYSNLASRLSDLGFLVVVISMEPFRIAYKNLGGDLKRIQRIMNQVEQRWNTNIVIANDDSNDDITNNRNSRDFQWFLLGHSMGSFCAMSIYSQWQQSLVSSLSSPSSSTFSSRGNTTREFHAVILLGIAAYYFVSTDLSSYDVPILKVQAKNDLTLDFRRPWQSQCDAHFNPHSTKTIWLPGGSHDGFANYDDPFSNFSGDNDKRREKQQIQACEVTVKFLKQTLRKKQN